MAHLNAHIETLSKNSVVFINRSGIRINLSYSTDDHNDIKVGDEYKFTDTFSLNLNCYDNNDYSNSWPDSIIYKIQCISLDKFNNISIIAIDTIDKSHVYQLAIDAPYSWIEENFPDIKFNSIITLSIQEHK